MPTAATSTETENAHATRAHRLLSGATDIVTRAADEAALQASFCALLIDEAGYHFAWISEAANDAAYMRPTMSAGDGGPFLAHWASVTNTAYPPVETVRRTWQPVTCPNLAATPADSHWHTVELESRFGAMITVPLVTNDQFFMGTLSCVAAAPTTFPDTERELLAELADLLVLGMAACRMRKANQHAAIALHAQEEFLRSFVAQPSDDIVLMDAAGHFRYASPSVTRHTGRLAEELTAQALVDLTHPEDQDAMEELLERARQLPERVHDLQFRLHHYNGAWRWIEIILINRLDDPAIGALVANFRDVTLRRQIETALHNAQYFQKTNVTCIGEGIIVFDRSFRYMLWNAYMEGLTGIAADDVLGRDAADLSPFLFQQDMTPLLARALTGETVHSDDIAFTQPNSGQTGWITCLFSPLLDEQDGTIGVIGIVQDITQRKLAEEALRLQEMQYRLLFTHMVEGVALCEMGYDATGQAVDYRFIDVNPAFEHFAGRAHSELVGHSATHFWGAPLPYLELFAQVAATGEPVVFDTFLERFARHVHLSAFSHKPGFVALVLEDITAGVRTQEEIQRMSKLDSLATMAGGIAHDFNNLLTAINGNIGLAQMAVEMGKADRLPGLLNTAETATTRARDLTMKLLTFAKGGAPIRADLAPAALIRDAAAMALTGSHSLAQVTCAPDLWLVHADAGQLTQVLHNLLINADQAMPEGGRVRVTAENARLSDDDGVPLPPGQYVVITVADEGLGIASEIREKIFDPFFSTKPKASGMGLASVYSIVRGHDGLVTVDSTPGRGSTFRIYLPAVVKQAAAQVVAAPPRRVVPWRILLFDDEPIILETLQMALESAGHTVETVADGAAAETAWRGALAAGTPFDLGIFDLTVPGGPGGKEVVERLRADHPTLRVVASSGYATDPIIANYRDYGFTDRLAKPYRIGEALALVARLQAEA
jgi:PAS domain S-box-containing protein